MRDGQGREIHYLRLSITDKCNLRCRYCMPDGVVRCTHQDILRYEEMLRLVRIMTGLGIDTVRVTGGEPLVRKDVDRLIAGIKRTPGIGRVGLTTNGVLLAEQLDKLLLAGLDSVNISLDTMNREKFQDITGFDRLGKVLTGIEAALEHKLPVKINCVPLKGQKEEEILALALLAKEKPTEVRFIEMMPVGQGRNAQGMDNAALKRYLEKKLGKMQPLSYRTGAGPAVCYQVAGFKGTIGFISAVHGKFCNSCNRIRLTAQGYLKQCLASNQGVDLRTLLRGDMTDDVLREIIGQAIYEKPSEHHFDRVGGVTEKKDMYCIGG